MLTPADGLQPRRGVPADAELGRSGSRYAPCPMPRIWHATIAVLVAVALVMQVWIAVRVSAVPPGHAVGTLRGVGLAGRILRVFSFFTIQSNVISGVASAQLARRPDRDGSGWRVLRLDALLGILITGIVYSTVLARIHQPDGWQETITNTLVHYIVPTMMLLGWLLCGPRPRISRRVMLAALAWPIVFVAYTLTAGAISSWYPYPFLDAATNGYGRVLINTGLVLVVFAVIGALLWWGDQALPPRPGRGAPQRPYPAPR